MRQHKSVIDLKTMIIKDEECTKIIKGENVCFKRLMCFKSTVSTRIIQMATCTSHQNGLHIQTGSFLFLIFDIETV